jgi:hypothetical protein
MSGALQITFMNQRSFAINPYYMGVIKPASGNLFPSQSFSRFTAANASNMYVVTDSSDINAGLFSITTAGALDIQTLQTVSGQTVGFNAVTADSSGNIYAGGTYNTGNTFLVKYDSSGSVIWAKSISGLTYSVSGVVTDSSENLYVSGRRVAGESYGDSNSRLTVAKFNSSGAIQWQKSYGSNIDGYRPGSVVQYDSLVYSICSFQNSISERFGTLVALNTSDGALSFQNRFPSNGLFRSIAVSPTTGNLYISGQSVNNQTLLIKTDSSGVLQWGRQLVVGTNPSSVAVDSDENVYICVKSDGAERVLVLAKYNSSGTIQWQRDITMPASYSLSSGASISTGVSGGVFVSVQIGDGTNYYPFVALFPNDGSGSGSYTFNGATFTYGASSYTAQTDSSTFSSVSNGLETTTRTVDNRTTTDTSAGATLIKETVA